MIVKIFNLAFEPLRQGDIISIHPCKINTTRPFKHLVQGGEVAGVRAADQLDPLIAGRIVFKDGAMRRSIHRRR